MLRTIVFICCLASVAAGAGMVFLPAGLIAGGGLGMAALVLEARGR